MLKVLGSDDAQEMKVAALIGLARHAQLMAAAGTAPDPKIVQALIGVIRQDKPEPGGTEDGLLWQKRIAIDALGDIGLPQAAQVLEPFLTDSSAPMMLRAPRQRPSGDWTTVTSP